MSYGRMDINLLPPELKPGPAVRYAMIFNVLIIAATLTYIALDSFLNLTMLSYARQERANLESEIEQNSRILADYDLLVGIRDRLVNYGRLIGLASADYVDIPVLLDRISHLLPDGVYLDRVTSDKSTGGATVPILISLRASRRDPNLVINTLKAFKQDPLFAQSYMPGLETAEQPLGELMLQNEINWTATTPDTVAGVIAPEYTFELRALVPRKLDNVPLPVAIDQSVYFSSLTKPTGGSSTSSAAPPADSGQSGTSPGQTTPAGPPAGVEVVEVH